MIIQGSSNRWNGKKARLVGRIRAQKEHEGQTARTDMYSVKLSANWLHGFSPNMFCAAKGHPYATNHLGPSVYLGTRYMLIVARLQISGCWLHFIVACIIDILKVQLFFPSWTRGSRVKTFDSALICYTQVRPYIGTCQIELSMRPDWCVQAALKINWMAQKKVYICKPLPTREYGSDTLPFAYWTSWGQVTKSELFAKKVKLNLFSRRQSVTQH